VKSIQEVYSVEGYRNLKSTNLFGYFQYAINDAIRRNVTLNPKDMVLDAGCGYGIISYALQKHAKHLGVNIDLHAFDLSLSMPEVFNGYVQEPVLLQCADAKNLAYRDNAFDTIICAGLFEHIENPVEVLNEYRRCLKTDGKLLLFVSPKNRLLQLILSQFGSPCGYRYSEFKPFLLDAGFKNVTQKYFRNFHIWANFCYFVIEAEA